MKVFVALFVSAFALAADPATMTGTWTMTLHAGHDIPTALVMKQQDTKVTGMIRLPTQNIGELIDVDLAGEFVDRTLTLSGAVEHADPPATVKITGTLKDDGTLEGTLAMHTHGVPWTAERFKERKPSGL
jgi:hypothetical protein